MAVRQMSEILFEAVINWDVEQVKSLVANGAEKP